MSLDFGFGNNFYLRRHLLAQSSRRLIIISTESCKQYSAILFTSDNRWRMDSIFLIFCYTLVYKGDCTSITLYNHFQKSIQKDENTHKSSLSDRIRGSMYTRGLQTPPVKYL
jgi:hypothetical protein